MRVGNGPSIEDQRQVGTELPVLSAGLVDGGACVGTLHFGKDEAAALAILGGQNRRGVIAHDLLSALDVAQCPTGAIA